MSGRGGIALFGGTVAVVLLALWVGRAREGASDPESPPVEARKVVAAPQPTPAQRSPATEGELVALRAELDRVYDELPTIAAAEAEPMDPHKPPKQLFPATKALGDIRDHVQALGTREAFAAAGGFYDRCARKEGVLASLRVLCLRNLMDLATSRPEAVTVDLATFPSRIAELAQQVPPLEY